MKPTLAPISWRSTQCSSKTGTCINHYPVDHAVRGDHTLCGICLGEQQWNGPAGLKRCAECQAVPAGHAVLWDLVGPHLTYRQLDYWTRREYLKAFNPDPGNGRRRYWPAEEVWIALTMGRLVAAGVTVKAARRAARNDGWLAEGVRVVVSSDHEC